MTDFEKVKQFLDEMGIGYEVDEEAQRYTADRTGYEPVVQINLKGARVSGNCEHGVIFEFFLDYTLDHVGGWEY